MPEARQLRSIMLRATTVGLLTLSISMAIPCAECVRADEGLVTVNGRPITEADLQLEAVLRRIPPEQIDARRDSLMDDLIDQTLIEAFLSRKRVKANPIELDAQIERLHALIRRRGEEPAELFKQLGINEEQLRDRLSVSLAWRAYVQRVTTDDRLRAYFDEQRRQLDGTQLRAEHIIIKVPIDDQAARNAAIARLTALRQKIVDDQLTFASAVTEHSQGPSREQEGDVGFFGHRGTMSAAFADAAFALDVGEMSEPVETPFGVHLIKVTDERPGQLSLEDVRGQVLEQISRQMRSEQIAQERPRASIVRGE